MSRIAMLRAHRERVEAEAAAEAAFFSTWKREPRDLRYLALKARLQGRAER